MHDVMHLSNRVMVSDLKDFFITYNFYSTFSILKLYCFPGTFQGVLHTIYYARKTLSYNLVYAILFLYFH